MRKLFTARVCFTFRLYGIKDLGEIYKQKYHHEIFCTHSFDISVNSQNVRSRELFWIFLRLSQLQVREDWEAGHYTTTPIYIYIYIYIYMQSTILSFFNLATIKRFNLAIINMFHFSGRLLKMTWRCPRGVMVKAMNWEIVVSVFEL